MAKSVTKGKVGSQISAVIESDPVEKAKALRPAANDDQLSVQLNNRAKRIARFDAVGGHNSGSNHSIMVGFLPSGVDLKDDELTENCLRAISGNLIEFASHTYLTDNQDVIDWLRYRIKTGKFLSVKEHLPGTRSTLVGDTVIYRDVDGNDLISIDDIMDTDEVRSLQDRINQLQAQLEAKERPDHPTPDVYYNDDPVLTGHDVDREGGQFDEEIEEVVIHPTTDEPVEDSPAAEFMPTAGDEDAMIAEIERAVLDFNRSVDDPDGANLDDAEEEEEIPVRVVTGNQKKSRR